MTKILKLNGQKREERPPHEQPVKPFEPLDEDFLKDDDIDEIDKIVKEVKEKQYRNRDKKEGQ